LTASLSAFAARNFGVRVAAIVMVSPVGARVAAGASRTCLGAEDAEACNRYLVTALEAGGDALDHGLDGALCVSLRAAERVLDLCCDVCLVHVVYA
jgi:hypothetical protein